MFVFHNFDDHSMILPPPAAWRLCALPFTLSSSLDSSWLNGKFLQTANCLDRLTCPPLALDPLFTQQFAVICKLGIQPLESLSLMRFCFFPDVKLGDVTKKLSKIAFAMEVSDITALFTNWCLFGCKKHHNLMRLKAPCGFQIHNETQLWCW